MMALGTMSWSNAKSVCEKNGATLPLIYNAQDNAAIYTAKTIMNLRMVWLGLTDTANEGTYVWTDGYVRNYYNWAPGEPNNYLDEDCVHMRESDALWNDYICSDSTPINVICEKGKE